jgi:hypothetical protein
VSLRILCLCAAASLHAAGSHHLQHNQFSPHNWNSVGTKFGWCTDPKAINTELPEFDPQGSYFNNGFTLRTVDGRADAFDGAMLTLAGGSLELRFAHPELDSRVPRLVVSTEDSTIDNGIYDGVSGLHIGHLELLGRVNLGKANRGYRSLRLRIDTLVGIGDIATMSDKGQVWLRVDDASAYSGDIIHQVGKLDFDAPFTSKGALVVSEGAVLVLDEPLVFSSVIIAGRELPPGTHRTFAEGVTVRAEGSLTVRPASR